MKMKEVDVVWYPNKASLSQVYGSGLEYAFLDQNYEMIHQPVYCKDFLQDAVSGHLTNKKVSIYYFVYDPAKHKPIYLKKTRILITDASCKDLASYIPGCVDFLRQFEKELKMVRTSIFKVSEKSFENIPKQYHKCGAFVFDSSARWMISPPMLSLYTLLIRCGLSHKVGDNYMDTIKGLANHSIDHVSNNGTGQINTAMKAINWILKYSDKVLFDKDIKKNYTHKDEICISFMHNNMGICSYSNGYNLKSMFPSWYEKIA